MNLIHESVNDFSLGKLSFKPFANSTFYAFGILLSQLNILLFLWPPSGSATLLGIFGSLSTGLDRDGMHLVDVDRYLYQSNVCVLLVVEGLRTSGPPSALFLVGGVEGWAP
jgi:hypothetical protein